MSSAVLTLPGEVQNHSGPVLDTRFPRWAEYLREKGAVAAGRHPAWLGILRDGLGHTPYCLEVANGERTRGLLPLAYVHSWLFGRFLVSLPYLNTAGVVADDEQTARLLISEAVKLADRLKVKYLELRHEHLIGHPNFTDKVNGKVHMRLPLPTTAGQLWDGFDAKVRNQVRKAQKNALTTAWGREDLLREFYAVFSHNMRDLGTPVYGRSLFRAILHHLPGQAEFCVVRAGQQAVAAGLLLHGHGVSEVPSASSLREFNATNANMLLYWNLLQRAVERGQTVFDFGRSSPDSNTCKFKKQWGALPHPAEWQYYCRNGHVSDARPNNPRFQRLIRLWRKLPLWLTRLLGPRIVRGIP
jgi:FemAB-related protein (PEP-CTERM system-associated)